MECLFFIRVFEIKEIIILAKSYKLIANFHMHKISYVRRLNIIFFDINMIMFHCCGNNLIGNKSRLIYN